MGVTVVFKGGSLNGIEITYETCKLPDDREEIFVRTQGSWDRDYNEVYVYVQELRSWVYDHTSEIVVEV